MRRLGADILEILREGTGLALRTPQDSETVHRFVQARLAALKLPSHEVYVNKLKSGASGNDEYARLIAAVTNPHTFFFRDMNQIRALDRVCEAAGGAKGRPLHIWSAGCSTGEEPYSLAMFCSSLGVDTRITATDINSHALDYAKGATYKAWSIRHCPKDHLKRYFRVEDDTYVVADGIRQRVSFRVHNLADQPFPSPPAPQTQWDAIFCRNVLLYFETEAIRRILVAFASVLAERGYLFISVTEHLRGLLVPFEVVDCEGTFVLRRTRRGEHTTPVPPAPPEPIADAMAPMPMKALQTTHLHTKGPLRPAMVPAPPSTRSMHDAPTIPAGPGRPKTDLDVFDSVKTLLKREDLSRAQVLLEDILRDDPKDVRARITLGNVFLRQHAFEDALAAYQEAQDENPLLPETHFFQGLVYRKLNDLTRAIESFRHALFLNPAFWHASFFVAGTYVRAGNTTKQQQHLKNALTQLKSKTQPIHFISHVRGMRDVDIPPDEAIDLCLRHIEPTAQKNPNGGNG